jgi:hypothetical protein
MKPCPNCGVEKQTVITSGLGVKVCCFKCFHASPRRRTQKEAVEAWNEQYKLARRLEK